MLSAYSRAIKELIDQLREPTKFESALKYVMSVNYRDEYNCSINGCRPRAGRGQHTCPKVTSQCSINNLGSNIWSYYRANTWEI
jgi:hypothetical protein